MELCANWNEVTIRQFVELQKLKESGDDIELQVKIISILSGKSIEEIEQLPLDEVKRLSIKTTFVFEVPRMQLMPKNIKINRKHYVINYRLDKLLFGEYIDLKNYTKTQELAIENLHKILSIFIVPVKKSWFGRKIIPETIEERNAKAEDFLNHLSAGVAYPMSVFFYNLLSNLTKGTQEYMIKTSSRKMLNVLRSLKRSM